MKKLVVLRHAKSSWGNPNLKDYDRPLNERGRLSAQFMAPFIHKLSIDQVYCSTAVRTKETYSLIFSSTSVNTKFDDDLYDAGLDKLMSTINSIDENVKTACIIGHNPGLSLLVGHLTGELQNMVTCAYAEITFDLDKWEEISGYTGDIIEYNYPKKHDKFLKLLS